MPDKSEQKLVPSKNRLKPGRHPAWLEATVPYRVEEWGKSGAYIVPRGASAPVGGPDLPLVRRRGRPGMGVIVTYIGDNTLAPRPKWAPAKYRILEEGYAYTEKEAQDRSNSYVRSRLGENAGRSRRRAKSARAAGVQASGSGSRFLAKS